MISFTKKELNDLLDRFIWAYKQVGKNNPEMPTEEQITEASNIIHDHLGAVNILVMLAIAIDRLSKIEGEK
jgi:hypothetical protein